MSSEAPRILGVNIDHVATLRQVRLAAYPDLAQAIREVEAGGADFITAHLREDRRHIQDADLKTIGEVAQTWLNLEVALAEEMVDIACAHGPKSVCLVPESREELTTEGGLDVVGQAQRVSDVTARLKAEGIEVSLFIDPDPAQIDASARAGADAIELHTGTFANARSDAGREAETRALFSGAGRAHAAGLIVNCGHGLTVDNVASLNGLPHVHEYNIGHSIVADALYCGLSAAVARMREALEL